MRDVIFDASSLYARAYYASKKPPSNDGRYRDDPGSPSELGVKMILNIVDPINGRLRTRPDRMLFCWDGKAKRDKQRSPKPEDYEEHKAKFAQVIKDLFGCAHAHPPDHEADDAVATAVYRLLDSPGYDGTIYVVSGDKDLQQLAGTRVCYYSLNEQAVLSTAFITDTWSIKRPSQICIALAILGDSGDNVPGIRGWGQKRVKKVFEAVTPEMNLSEALEAIKAQIPAHLMPSFEESLDLTILDPDVPDVPDPLPLTFTSSEIVRSLGLDGIVGHYAQVRNSFENESVEDLATFIESV